MIICVLFLRQILFVLQTDAMHNNVVCPRSAVGYLYVMCSCSADRCSHGNIRCSCSSDGCSHEN